MAESNLAKEPQLVEGREIIVQLSAEGEELSNRVKEKYDKMSKYIIYIICQLVLYFFY